MDGAGAEHGAAALGPVPQVKPQKGEGYASPGEGGPARSEEEMTPGRREQQIEEGREAAPYKQNHSAPRRGQINRADVDITLEKSRRREPLGPKVKGERRVPGEGGTPGTGQWEPRGKCTWARGRESPRSGSQTSGIH